MAATSEHKFCISRAKDVVFGADQFRDWLTTRDLGLGEATAGAFGAQVTRARELGRDGAGTIDLTFRHDRRCGCVSRIYLDSDNVVSCSASATFTGTFRQ